VCDRIVAAVLGEGTVVGNDCVVGTGVKLPPNDVLPDSVVVHAPRNSRRTLSDTKEVGEKPLYPTTTILAHHIKLTAVTCVCVCVSSWCVVCACRRTWVCTRDTNNCSLQRCPSSILFSSPTSQVHRPPQRGRPAPRPQADHWTVHPTPPQQQRRRRRRQ
jgi:hypothetical protein